MNMKTYVLAILLEHDQLACSIILLLHILIYIIIVELYVRKMICMYVKVMMHVTTLTGIMHVRIDVVQFGCKRSTDH